MDRFGWWGVGFLSIVVISTVVDLTSRSIMESFTLRKKKKRPNKTSYPKAIRERIKKAHKSPIEGNVQFDIGESFEDNLDRNDS